MQLVSRGDFHMFFGQLSEAHLKRYPVWCEYYEPKELEDFPQLSPTWLRENLFSRMESTNSHPLYATDRDIDLESRAFLCAAAHITVLQKTFPGYLFLSQGQPLTAHIFSGGESFALYSNDMFDIANVETIRQLFGGDSPVSPNPIALSYDIACDKIDWLARDSKLWIPISQEG